MQIRQVVKEDNIKIEPTIMCYLYLNWTMNAQSLTVLISHFQSGISTSALWFRILQCRIINPWIFIPTFFTLAFSTPEFLSHMVPHFQFPNFQRPHKKNISTERNMMFPLSLRRSIGGRVETMSVYRMVAAENICL